MNSIEKVANALGYDVAYFISDDEKEGNDIYYLNDDAREMAQFMFENPKYKVLFDATRKISAKDIDTVAAILDKFRSDDL